MLRVLRRLLGRRPAVARLPGETEGAEVLEFTGTLTRPVASAADPFLAFIGGVDTPPPHPPSTAALNTTVSALMGS